MKWIYRRSRSGRDNISPGALHIDDRVGWFITLIGIPSAFLLHGYVGFIFGSVKANPWWSTPLMPVVFIFSAMVSGIAAVLLLYMLTAWLRGQPIDMRCVDTIARYLLYTFIIDFSLEMLDLLHRIYEADESFRSLDFMVHTRLFTSAGDPADLSRDSAAHRVLALDAGGEAHGIGAQRLVCPGRRTDDDRDLCDALECRDRRTALLEELPRIHDLQNGLRHARRTCCRPSL